MSVDQKLLAWEAMLVRLGAAMASAEAEAKHSSALEDRLSRLLAGLTAGQPTPEQTSPFEPEETDSPDPAHGSGEPEAADPPSR